MGTSIWVVIFAGAVTMGIPPSNSLGARSVPAGVGIQAGSRREAGGKHGKDTGNRREVGWNEARSVGLEAR